MNIFELPFNHIAKLYFVSVKKNLFWLSLGFAAISIIALIVASNLPKVYTSSTTIEANKQNILSPLMKGTAVSTTTGLREKDRIALYQEVIFSKKVMNEVIVHAGWIDESATEIEKSRMIRDVISKTTVTKAGPNFVKIEFTDGDPQQAFRTTKILGDLFIGESVSVAQRESNDAYEFISSQADDYHQKLLVAEQKLKNFKTKAMDESMGSEAKVFARVSKLRHDVEKTTLEIQEERIRLQSIQRQLSGEEQVASSITREGQLLTQISQLQQQLAQLRLDYHDSYPDIVRLKHQIEDLRTLLNNPSSQEPAVSINQGGADSFNVNPAYANLRDELTKTKTRIAALQSRIAQSQKLLGVELERAKKMPEFEAALAELVRDYEVTNKVYEDLVKRRERARVSMNIDLEQRDQRFRIQEPALLPLEANGLNFAQVAALGPLAGIAMPLGVLLALFQLNPYIRHKSMISKQLNTKVLGEIPETMLLSNPKQKRKSVFSAILVFALVANIYLVVFFVKYKDVLGQLA